MIVKTLTRLARVTRRYVITGRFRAEPGPIIERFFDGKDCFFVQVGSNDGIVGPDPLHNLIKANPRWRGIFIEPQEAAFSQLIANYGLQSRFSFERLAIADSAGERPFYSLSSDGIRETGVPATFNVFASLNREYVLRELARAMQIYGAKGGKTAAAYMSETLVRCEPLMSVLNRNRVSRIDLFHVDAESSDFQIIRQIDFRKYAPKLILYEHCALGLETKSAKSFLEEKGYRLISCGVDTIAVRRSHPITA